VSKTLLHLLAKDDGSHISVIFLIAQVYCDELMIERRARIKNNRKVKT
jgi:hypothetical protein